MSELPQFALRLVAVAQRAACVKLGGSALELSDRAIALTGYGNIDDGRFSTPSLTTVDLDLPEIARLAVELISRRTAGDLSAPQRTVVPTTLVRAESTLGATHAEQRGAR